MWGVHEGMGWWMVFGGLWMVLFWALVIGAIVWLVARVTTREHATSPLDLAKERYARGEISREEFERIRRDLQKLA